MRYLSIVLYIVLLGTIPVASLGLGTDPTIKTNDDSPAVIYYGNWSEIQGISFCGENSHLSNVPYANCYFHL
jgi:hypothetical protein